jgi:hypothetical protein
MVIGGDWGGVWGQSKAGGGGRSAIGGEWGRAGWAVCRGWWAVAYPGMQVPGCPRTKTMQLLLEQPLPSHAPHTHPSHKQQQTVHIHPKLTQRPFGQPGPSDASALCPSATNASTDGVNRAARASHPSVFPRGRLMVRSRMCF